MRHSLRNLNNDNYNANMVRCMSNAEGIKHAKPANTIRDLENYIEKIETFKTLSQKLLTQGEERITILTNSSSYSFFDLFTINMPNPEVDETKRNIEFLSKSISELLEILREKKAIFKELVRSDEKSLPTKPFSIPSHLVSFINKLERAYPEYEKYAKTVLNSSHYTEEEKNQFLETAKTVYESETFELIQPTDWIDQSITTSGMKYLENIYPHFKTLNDNQLDAKDFNATTVSSIMANFPETLPMEPLIYGQAIRVGGGHRTSYIVDFKNKTVEYFNSFGDDGRVKNRLPQLAQALTIKYGATFKYLHRTETGRFQKDKYQCGAWACKLIEDRIKLNDNFTTRGYEDFDIAGYRKQLYLNALEYKFFHGIGAKRMTDYLKKEYKITGQKALHMIPPFAPSLYPEWCRTGIMPQKIKEHLRQMII